MYSSSNFKTKMALCNQIVSLNVRGLRDSRKRQEIFRWLKKNSKGENIIFLQETHTSEKDVTKWEREWKSKIIMDHGSTNSKGVAILLPSKPNFTIDNVKISKNGRKIILNLKREDVEYCLINIYAPTQNMEKEQLTFFNNLEKDITENIDKKIIIGGDFNLTLDKIDKYGENFKITHSVSKIKSLMKSYDLLDIFRINNPDVKRYTWRRHNPLNQSRLDYWLIGADVTYNILETDIKPSIKTDHSLITLTFTETNQNSARGRGLWKFNSSLLSDIDYVHYLIGMIDMQKENFKDITNPSLKWELVKFKLRDATIKYSKTQANLKKEYEENLNNNLHDVAMKLDKEYSENLHEKYTEIKNELENINAIKTEGFRIRSKSEYIEHNEKGNKYFIAMEKRNARINNISRLILENGRIETSPKEILLELHNFYKSLYSSRIYDQSIEDHFFTCNVPKLSEENKELCDNQITMCECEMALHKMKKDKSPGTDGFTIEFYQYFWKDIKELVFDSLTAAYDNKELSYEQRRGVIKLIPKKDKDLCYIKNWRPISLLNTDYKILTNILSNRMQVVLPSIISMDQTAYLKTRNISINIRSIYDVIDHTVKKENSSLIAFLDFEKAFDKLNWTFIDRTLEKTGFGESFRKWINIIYTNSESCIINNGTTSPYFKIHAGVRQGCPLSALLFILAVEILAIAIRNDPSIKGVDILNKTYKISQLADDTTLFLKDTEALKHVLEKLKLFEKLSCLKLNMSKTEILQIGRECNTNYTLYGLKWEKEKVYALGSWFYKDNTLSVKNTYEQKLEMIKRILNQWSHRHLTLIGKITVIKTLCISKINYTIASIETPNWFLSEIKNMFETFLWNGKPPRIKNKVLYNDYENGGLRMTNIQMHVNAQLASWIKRLLQNKNSVPFNYISSLIHMNMTDFLKCSFDSNNFPQDFPDFYKNIFCAWFAIKEAPKTKDDVLREVIWHNKYIKIQNKTLFAKPLYEKGLTFLNDIVDEKGNFISYECLTKKYGRYLSQYEYLCIKHSIPRKWCNILKQPPKIKINPKEEDVYINVNNKSKPACSVTSNNIYWTLHNKEMLNPSCLNAWFEKYYIDFSKGRWKYVFTLAKLLTCDTKMREFQYKIIHRVYASNSYVSNFDATVQKNCQNCKVEDNIVHLFVHCQKVKQFWTNFKEFITKSSEKTFSLTTAEIIFGKFGISNTAPNFCILHAKWFIHLNKKENNISFNCFKKYLKNVFIIERQIYLRKGKQKTFSKLFDSYVKMLDH